MKIALIGDLIKDIFIHGNFDKPNPEGPFPLITQDHIEVRDGGAGNVFQNLKSLGLDVKFFHLDTTLSSRKTRIVVGNSIIFRLDNDLIGDNSTFLESLSHINFAKFDYTILSDYNKGALHNVQSIMSMLKNTKVIVDPKQDLKKYKGAWCIKPNKKEFEQFYGECTESNILKFYKENDHKLVIVTLGKNGVMYCYNGTVRTIKAVSQDVADVTGAGDSFLSAFVYAISNGYSIDKAIEIGNIGAGVSVKHIGTYTLTKQDLIKTKVFTNGCFDVLHRGHFDLLEKSKELGDYLIVGMNSDESVKRLKGDSRPINNQEDRKRALEAIKHVDEVIIFDEDTPYNLIKKINPDIITKGGDYNINEVVGNDITAVKIIPFTQGYSTTKILETL